MRKGRPLLVAATGVALVSFVQCAHKPVGNLSAPVQPQVDAGLADAAVDAEPPPHPVGNLRPPPQTPTSSVPPGQDSADAAGAPPPHPVGNLRPPVQPVTDPPPPSPPPHPHPHPVGNLRPPPVPRPVQPPAGSGSSSGTT